MSQYPIIHVSSKCECLSVYPKESLQIFFARHDVSLRAECNPTPRIRTERVSESWNDIRSSFVPTSHAAELKAPTECIANLLCARFYRLSNRRRRRMRMRRRRGEGFSCQEVLHKLVVKYLPSVSGGTTDCLSVHRGMKLVNWFD